MAYAESDDLEFPRHRELRERARKRHVLTQIAMFSLGLLGMLAAAGFLYFVGWMLWLGCQTVAGETQSYVRSAASADR